jgi:hypothetical protein
MRWSETVAAQCRWSEYAEELFHDWNVIWDNSTADYQGHGEFVALKNERVAYVYWSYGSCSGCDGWEGVPEQEVRKDFLNGVDYFESFKEFEQWVEFRNNEELKRFLS